MTGKFVVEDMPEGADYPASLRITLPDGKRVTCFDNQDDGVLVATLKGALRQRHAEAQALEEWAQEFDSGRARAH